MSYKLVAVDIDGTLVGEDLVVRPDTKRVLQECRSKGIVVTLATGRMFQSTVPYAEKVGISAPLITYNGGLVKDSQTGEIYHHRPVPADLAQRVVELTQELGVMLHSYVDDKYYVEEYNDWAKRYEDIATVKAHVAGNLAVFLQGKQPTKFIISAEPEQMDTFIDYLHRELDQDLYLTRSRPFFLEIMHKDVSKVEGLEVLGRRFGIQLSEMVAIGDSYNDVEMLDAVGLGIAMGNAPSPVQKVADWVTGTIDQEGLVTAVEKYLLNK